MQKEKKKICSLIIFLHQQDDIVNEGKYLPWDTVPAAIADGIQMRSDIPCDMK